MSGHREAKSIKSAQRVFEVLEYFDADHPEASVTDIALRYGYPQSSASELLSYMVSLGYLRRGQRGRTYQLSIRVAMLGTWVQPGLMREGRLLPMMDKLARDSGATVVLAGNSGVRLRVFHVVAGDGEAGRGLRQGDCLPLLHSAEGRALLVKCDRQLARKYAHRLNAEEADPALRIRAEELAVILDEVERKGFARLDDGQKVSMAIALPHSDPAEPLALSVHAPSGADEQQLLRRLSAAVSGQLGLVDIGGGAALRAAPLRQMA